MSFLQPPNRTNHKAIHGPTSDLFTAEKERKVLAEDENTPHSLNSRPNGCVSNGDAHRWSFLCLEIAAQFNQSVVKTNVHFFVHRKYCQLTARYYKLSLPHNKIPDELCQLAKKMAASAMPIIYIAGYKSSTLVKIQCLGNGTNVHNNVCVSCQEIHSGGHLDDMEADWSKPIAIFLSGGKSRDDPPLAVFLQSGDVVLMAGGARECFHARIFSNKENTEIATLESHFCDEIDFQEFIRTSRININIRQVF
ncbi:hypothetical protein BDE02_01G051900 [Populus trichocarpa]|nr:hypothetical protein BDE02_01G051900 [Populus trichocarpa]